MALQRQHANFALHRDIAAQEPEVSFTSAPNTEQCITSQFLRRCSTSRGGSQRTGRGSTPSSQFAQVNFAFPRLSATIRLVCLLCFLKSATNFCPIQTRFTFPEDPDWFYHASWVDGYHVKGWFAIRHILDQANPQTFQPSTCSPPHHTTPTGRATSGRWQSTLGPRQSC